MSFGPLVFTKYIFKQCRMIRLPAGLRSSLKTGFMNLFWCEVSWHLIYPNREILSGTLFDEEGRVEV